MSARLVYCLNYRLTTLSRSLWSTQNLEKVVHSNKKNLNLFQKANSGVLQKVLQ